MLWIVGLEAATLYNTNTWVTMVTVQASLIVLNHQYCSSNGKRDFNVVMDIIYGNYPQIPSTVQFSWIVLKWGLTLWSPHLVFEHTHYFSLWSFNLLQRTHKFIIWKVYLFYFYYYLNRGTFRWFQSYYFFSIFSFTFSDVYSMAGDTEIFLLFLLYFFPLKQIE